MDNKAFCRGNGETERKDPCDSVNWNAYRFVATSEIEDVIARALQAAQVRETYLSISTIFEKMRSVVTIGDRRAHLEALSHFQWSEVTEYALADAIAASVTSVVSLN
jgi:hypothetical protein